MTNDVTYSWTTHETTRKAHLIEEVACDRVVACEGDVRSRPVSLCGNIVADHAERREFRGFGNYRDLTWCQMCRAVYQKRQPDTVAAGQEVDD